jgi:ABC-type amino acid transport substrate-binding protein
MILKSMIAATSIAVAALALLSAPAAQAQELKSRLYEITKNKKLRVCQYPLYYSISYRNPKTGKIEGIDADLAKELASELGATLEIVESSFVRCGCDAQAGTSGRVLQALPGDQYLRRAAQE